MFKIRYTVSRKLSLYNVIFSILAKAFFLKLGLYIVYLKPVIVTDGAYLVLNC